jgi:MFS family permease
VRETPGDAVTGDRRDWRAWLSSQSVLAQAVWVAVRLMIGYRAIDLGAGASYLALLTATFAVPALLAALPSGRLADRYGGSVTAAAGMFLGAVGIVVIVLVPGLALLLAGSAVIGLGNMLAMVGQQTVVAHVSGHDRDAAFGFLSASASAGQMIGPPLVTAAATTGRGGTPDTDVGLLVCLALSVLALPLSIPLGAAEGGGTAPDADATAGRARRPALTAGVWRAMAISGVVLVSMDMLVTFLPVWALENGVEAGDVGLLLAVRAGVSLVSRVGLGVIVRVVGRMRVIALSTAVAAGAMALLPVVDLSGAVAVMVLLGFGLGIPQPLTMAWAVSLTDPARHGYVLSLRIGANRLAQIAIPLTMSATVAPLGAAGVFWANSSLLAGCVALAALGPGRNGVDDQEQDP